MMDRDTPSTTADDCLMPDRLLKVALGKDVWTASEAEHLPGCSPCRRRFAQLIRARRSGSQAEQLAHTLLAAFITRRAQQRVARLAVPMQYHVGPARGRSRLSLVFDDPELHATLYQNSDRKHCLELSQTGRPVGLLLRVRLGDEGGSAPPWTRFAMLREYFPSPLARLLVEEALSEQPASMAVDLIPSALALTEQDVPVLLESFAAALRDDPPAESAWKAWAEQERNVPGLDAAVRTGLDEIALGTSR
jgi:hypothetical protein